MVARRKWIQRAIKKPGALHEGLGIAAGHKIPESKLSVKPGDSPLMKKRKSLARTLKRMKERS